MLPKVACLCCSMHGHMEKMGDCYMALDFLQQVGTTAIMSLK